MDTVIRLFFLLAFIVSVGLMGIGIGHLGPTSTGGILCVAPIVVCLLAVFAVAFPYDKALGYRNSERNWHRAADLIRRVELAERFELRGWPPLIPGLIYVTVALSVAASTALAGAWPAFFIAIVCALLGSPMFLRNIPHLSAPLISCDAQGFRSGAYGEFSWQDIEAIALQRVSIRGITLYTLTMRAPVVMQRLDRLHPRIAQPRSSACS